MKFFFPLLFPVALALLSTGCSRSGEQSRVADTTYTLSLSVEGLDSGVFMLYYNVDGNRRSDTIRVRAGKGMLTGKMPSTVRAYLQRAYPPGFDMATLYLENGTIDVSGILDSMAVATVKGTASNDLNQELRADMGVVREAEAVFSKRMAEGGGETVSQDSLFAFYNRIEKLRKKITFGFIARYPSSFVSAAEVQDLFLYNPDVAQFDSVVRLLDSVVLKTAVGKEIIKRLDIARRTDIGQPAPQFTLNNVEGQPVILSSLFGKYLLIDFWASWCGPCREDNPNLVRTWRDYNKKGFDILSVSLDDEKDKDKWIAAIKKDQLAWLQVSDLKGWDNAAARMYGINGIPMNFLLDPKGTIIAKGMRGTELRKKVESLIR